MRFRMAATAAVALATAALGAATSALAQYPTRPVTMIVPLAAGGSTDVIGRLTAEAMSRALGQSIVVENVSGAGGSTGVVRVARANADGYTFMIGQWGTNVATGAIYNLPIDLLADLQPIGLIATQPFLLVSRKTMEATDLKGLIAWLKANPDKATQGHAGIGSPGHVAGIFLQNAMGLKWVQVAYRSAGPALQDVMTNNIDIALDTPATSKGHIEAGNLKVFGVTSTKRIASMPNVPTLDEAGVPGYSFQFWHALWAPKGIPAEALTKLSGALKTALADEGTRGKLIAMSQDIFSADQQTPEALAKFQKAEIDRWWPVIKAAGIKPN
jgi:tripartite-type tricarboxylate transporter receptor subunit TctC